MPVTTATTAVLFSQALLLRKPFLIRTNYKYRGVQVDLCLLNSRVTPNTIRARCKPFLGLYLVTRSAFCLNAGVINATPKETLVPGMIPGMHSKKDPQQKTGKKVSYGISTTCWLSPTLGLLGCVVAL